MFELQVAEENYVMLSLHDDVDNVIAAAQSVFGSETAGPTAAEIEANRIARKEFIAQKREELSPKVAWGSRHPDQEKHGPLQRAKWTKDELDWIEKYYQLTISNGQVIAKLVLQYVILRFNLTTS